MAVVAIKSASDLVALPAYSNGLVVLSFWAAWSEPSKQMNTVVAQLSKQYQAPSVQFATVEAEEVGDVTEKYGVEAVPAFVFLMSGKPTETLKGANAPELTKKVAALAAGVPSAPTEDKKATLNKRLEHLVNSHNVMAFIKGTPEAPQCGFSNKFCAILKKNNIEFGSFDILSDPEVRQGLKEFSNWPTYPQLYIKGKLVGGLDIVKELDDDGELAGMAN